MKTLKRLGPVVVIMVLMLVGASLQNQKPTAWIQEVRALPSKQKVLPKATATVFLDAGHGAIDSGMIPVSGDYEKDVNLDLVLRIGEILEANGVEVSYSRTSDVPLGNSSVADLQNRIDMSIAANAELFVSIHCNASEQATRSGFEIYTDPNDRIAYSLSENIAEKLESVDYTQNNGIIDATELLHLVVFARVPTALVEVGYLDNESDNSFIQSEQGRQKIAEAIANGILTKINES